MARTIVEHFIPFFGRDFLTSTTGWTAEERGHYVTLLIVQWEQGSVPDAPERLEIVSPGLSRCWAILEPKFPISSPGRRQNPRMEMHRAKASALKDARTEAGKIGNQKRWGETPPSQGDQFAIANGVANTIAKVSPPSPSPSPTPHQEKCSAHTQGADAVFDRPGWAADAWERFVSAWNRTERAVPWTPLLPPDGWVDLAATPGWLARANEAMARLPACEYFDRPVAVTRFFGYVDRILAGEFNDQKQDRRGRRQPIGGNL